MVHVTNVNCCYWRLYLVHLEMWLLRKSTKKISCFSPSETFIKFLRKKNLLQARWRCTSTGIKKWCVAQFGTICTILKREKHPWRSITLLRGCFLCFLNCTNGIKSRNATLLCDSSIRLFLAQRCVFMGKYWNGTLIIQVINHYL